MTLVEQVTAWRDESAERQDTADSDSQRKYWEGKRDAFDVVLWKLREEQS